MKVQVGEAAGFEATSCVRKGQLLLEHVRGPYLLISFPPQGSAVSRSIEVTRAGTELFYSRRQSCRSLEVQQGANYSRKRAEKRP
jgi:hypothetical protein